MAAKPIPMNKVKQFLVLYQQGLGIKTISRQLEVSRNTIKAYIKRLNVLLKGDPESEKRIQSLLKMDNPALESVFLQGPMPVKSDRMQSLLVFLEKAAAASGRVGFTRSWYWERYHTEVPDGYRKTQFFAYLKQFMQATKPSMVLEHQPAKEMMVDFAGKKLHYVDRNTGEVIEVQVLVCTLPYSDYGFAIAVRSQRTEDFIGGLQACLDHLGGAPQILVPDNLKAAVIEANRYEPSLNVALNDFCAHYNMAVISTRVNKPQDKALVENHVKLVYQRVFAPLHEEVFFDLESLNRAIQALMNAHNARAMQQKPNSRLTEFTAAEKPHLKPLPAERFQLKYYSQHKVGKNNHVYVSQDKHSYSVPFRLIGLTVKLVRTTTMVYIYHQGEQVAVHARGFKQGGYTRVNEHLCSAHQAYLERSPEYYTGKAKQLSPELGELFERIFSQPRPPETLYKTCNGILNLARKASRAHIAKVCEDATSCGVYNYRFIENLFAKASKPQIESHIDTRPLPVHPNTRGAAYYQNQLFFDPNTVH
jgi:transposase